MIDIRNSQWMRRCLVIIVSICLSGCLFSTPSTVTPKSSFVTKPTPTATPVLKFPDQKPVNTAVSSTQTSVLLTATPILLTPTPKPTPTTAERYDFVREMLKTNDGCELPCWWGITPGGTTWQTVKEDLGLFHGKDRSQPDGTVYHEGPVYGGSLASRQVFDYYVGMDFIERNEVVESIEVRSEVRDASGQFAQDWQQYSINQVLSCYGQPSQIYIHLVPAIEKGAPVYYQLWITYNHLGFFIVYTGPATHEPPIIRACPRFEDVTAIALRLKPPRQGISVLESPESLRTLEETTGMDVETFHEQFKGPTSDACLESASHLWP